MLLMMIIILKSSVNSLDLWLPIIFLILIAAGIFFWYYSYRSRTRDMQRRNEQTGEDGLTPMERVLLKQMEAEALAKQEAKKQEEEQVQSFLGKPSSDGAPAKEHALYPVSEEDVRMILGDEDPAMMARDLESARYEAVTLQNQGKGIHMRGSAYGVGQRLQAVRSLSQIGGRKSTRYFEDGIQDQLNEFYNSKMNYTDRKVNNSLGVFYDVYFDYIVRPILEHFFGDFQYSHEEGALYQRINEVFQIVYGRAVSAIFERVNSEDHLSAVYKELPFDQVDVVVSKGMGQHIFSGRAISYRFSTGVSGTIVVVERGTFEGIEPKTTDPAGSAGSSESEEPVNDYSDLEADGLFGGFDLDPSASAFERAKADQNKAAREGTVWANDTATSLLFPNLEQFPAQSESFGNRFQIFSDDAESVERFVTSEMAGYLEKLHMPGNLCLIFEPERILLLRNRISGMMEVDLSKEIDPELEIRKTFYDLQETTKLLDALAGISKEMKETAVNTF